jgi:hypothetical protein
MGKDKDLERRRKREWIKAKRAAIKKAIEDQDHEDGLDRIYSIEGLSLKDFGVR